VTGAPSNTQTLEKIPVPLFFLQTEAMVRVTPLAFAALLSLAAIEVVVVKSQQHLRDSSGFLDSCNLIATSISNASVVYYPRESSFAMPRPGLTGSPTLLSLGEVLHRHCALVRIKHGAICVQR
jgi:hypothetical protein